MIIKPKVRGFVCITAHPIGCAAHVQEQIDYVKRHGELEGGPRKVLVLGASTGYGLASRIVSGFGSGAATLGVFFERPSLTGKPASPGWYNSAAYEQKAREAGLWAKSVNGDAFSDEVKEKVVALIREELEEVDLVIYSLASPRRQHPKTGRLHKSVIKPIGRAYTAKSLDTDKKVVSEVTVEPATEEEIEDTVATMGGEDWEMWIDALESAGVLAAGATSVAFDYVGPELTWPIYRYGTIGRAKEHLLATAERIDARLKVNRGRAFLSVNKAVVTQASSAIPVVPLYFSLLFRVMKAKGLHEGCIEQIYRLFATRMYNGAFLEFDERGRVRIDDWEMRDDVQAETAALWEKVTTENLEEIADFAGHHTDFMKLFGFGIEGVDYDAEVDPVVEMD